MDHRNLWQAVLGELEVTQTRANFATWFRNTHILSNESGHIIIGVPNAMTKTWLETKFLSEIQAVLDRIGAGVRSIEFKVGSAPASGPLAASLAATPAATLRPKTRQIEPAPGFSVASHETSGVSEQPVALARATLTGRRVPPSSQAALPLAAASTFGSSNLNPRYTFDNFVVGASNELAYAAAVAVAREPGSKYNPLYLYGGVGLGKTHLMQAIGNEIHRRDPAKRIEYVTIESFTNEFIEAIQKKKNTAFTDKYRSVDVLIIDDMQFLAGKEKTQDEFFHTFNALHQSNKQIIISSDKPPQLLSTLEERLRSRFSWGMTADVHAPDLETRQAILQNKAAAQGIALESGVIDYLARHADHNIRELEGVLTQLLAFCELRGLQPTVTAAQQLLAGQAAARPKTKPMSPKMVIERVASYFDLSSTDITGPKRDKEIVVPRQIAMYLLREEMNLSYPKIGSSVGGRDHTTAMHSVTKISKALVGDDDLREDIEAIREQLAPVAV